MVNERIDLTSFLSDSEVFWSEDSDRLNLTCAINFLEEIRHRLGSVDNWYYGDDPEEVRRYSEDLEEVIKYATERLDKIIEELRELDDLDVKLKIGE